MTRKNDLEREKCGRNFYVRAEKLDTSLLPCCAAQGYRVTLPLKIGSRENTDVEMVSLYLSIYLCLSTYLSHSLSTQRLRRTKDRFSGSAVEDRSKFFSSGEPVAKKTMSRKMFLRETKKRLLNETGYDLRGWL